MARSRGDCAGGPRPACGLVAEVSSGPGQQVRRVSREEGPRLKALQGSLAAGGTVSSRIPEPFELRYVRRETSFRNS